VEDGQGDAGSIRIGPGQIGRTTAGCGRRGRRCEQFHAHGTLCQKFANRFFNVGIAESNLVGIAAGLASSGKQAWVSSFAAFVMCNAYDQLRMSVAFPNIDVKVVGTHAGISIGEDGPSQMGIEDVSLACSLPNFTVVVPADEIATEKAVQALAGLKTPGYLRAGRPNVPLLYEKGCDFRLGKAIRLRDGKEVTIIANGLLVAPAMDAAETLRGRGFKRASSTCIPSSHATMPPCWPRRAKLDASS